MSSRRVQNISGFTPQQIEAIQSALVPTLIIAGAGSGKTLVLAKRFEYLVLEKNIDPRKILVVTFSKKAASNMKKRIFKYVQMDSESEKQCHIYTFHKFSMELLKEEKNITFSMNHICHLTKDKGIWRDCLEDVNSEITARDLSWKLMKKLRWIMKRDSRQYTFSEFLSIGMKVTKYGEDKFLTRFPSEVITHAHEIYDQRLKEQELYSFDDLILETNLLLDDESIRDKWSKKFDAILCDEFQDIDDVQFEMLKKLTNNNIFCVGDPDQSIYGFRGAVPNIFNEFSEHFNRRGIDVEVKKLEKNFRSTPEILEVANTLINSDRDNEIFQKTLFTDHPSGPKVSLYITNDANLEEDEIIRKILDLHENKKVPLKEIAVLARNFKHGKSIMDKLLVKRIPYDNPRAIRGMLTRMEIKDLICWFNIAFVNDTGVIGKSIKRVINKPARGIGPKKLEELYRFGPKMVTSNLRATTNAHLYKFGQLCDRLRKIANDVSRGLSMTQKMKLILKESGFYEHYKQDTEKLNSVDSFMKRIFSDTDSVAVARNKMREFTTKSLDGDELIVSTIHGVKGLEFGYVFLMKFGEGQLPSSIGIKNATSEKERLENIAEERRLAYVAMTRAKNALYISSSTGTEKVSRFVGDIKHLLDPVEIRELDAGEISLEDHELPEEDILSFEEIFMQEYEDNLIEEDDEDDQPY